MPPKRGSQVKEEGRSPKRSKSSANSKSRSATPPDSTDPNFAIVYPSAPIPTKRDHLSKKDQILADASEFLVSPFVSVRRNKDGELDQHYTVTPASEWASMKKYNNFIIQGETYTNKQFVFVRKEDTPITKGDEPGKLSDFWIARIIQVRAKNAQHVYALVAWMYWPNELPLPASGKDLLGPHTGGRRKYHGVDELVASNYLDVLDVLSFAGKADVTQWGEEWDTPPQGLFWRQTFCRSTQALSKLQPHCLCTGYFNPSDKSMLMCEDQMCREWFHEECVVDDVLSKTWKKLIEEKGLKGVKPGKRKRAGTKQYSFTFKATISTENPPQATITDLRPQADPKTWTEAVACPKCGKPLQ